MVSLRQCLPHTHSFNQTLKTSFQQLRFYKCHENQRGINRCSGERRQHLLKGRTIFSRTGQPGRTLPTSHQDCHAQGSICSTEGGGEWRGNCINSLENRLLFFISQHILLSASKSCADFILCFSAALSLKRFNFLQTLTNATLKYASEVSWGYYLEVTINELQQILLQWLLTPSPHSSASSRPQSHPQAAGREEQGLDSQCLWLPSPHPQTRQNGTNAGWHLVKETCMSVSPKPST